MLLEQWLLSFIRLRVQIWGTSDVVFDRLDLVLLKVRCAVRGSLLLWCLGSRIGTFILVEDSLLEVVMCDFNLIRNICLTYRVL